MDLTGKWVVIDSYFKNKEGYEFTEEEISFRKKEASEDTCTTVKFGYRLEDALYFLRDSDCKKIIISNQVVGVPELFCHMEEIDGEMIPFVSEMIMEYDGRGLIVFATYVREEDQEKVPQDYKTLLYKVCNERPAPSMRQDNNPMGSFMGKVSTMGMGVFQSLKNNIPAGSDGEAWDCSCGAKGNTRKFCQNCGARKP